MPSQPRSPDDLRLTTLDARATLDPDDLRRFDRALANLSPRQGWFERLFRLVIRVWCRLCGWRLEVRFRTALPTQPGRTPGAGCIVVAAPHRAWIEPFLLMAAWPPDAARLAWFGDARTMTRSWWRRHLLPRLGAIPITCDRRGPRDYVAVAAAALERGVALAVFPESGPSAAADRLRRVSPGFAYIARGSGARVVPVVMGGTHHIVRGSSFSVDLLDAIDAGSPDDDPFTLGGRSSAHELARRYESEVAAVLSERTAWADARRPPRDRWTWLATLLE